MKGKLILLACCLVLTGCGKEEQIIEDTPSSVVLELPQSTQEPTIIEEEPDESTSTTPVFEVDNRTNIMVSDSNKDTFNKKTEPEGTEETEEPEEENPLLSRFKQNQDNIKLPDNYKVSGTINITEDKSVTLSVLYKDKQAYTVYNYNGVVIEQFVVDNTVGDNIKEVYGRLTNDTSDIKGKLPRCTDLNKSTYSDFKVLGVEYVSKKGNNYDVKSSFIINGEQVNGTITVGDNMNVYSINYDYNGINYSLKVQTLLKMPIQVSDFSAVNLTEDDYTTYCNYFNNVFSQTKEETKLVQQEESEDVPSGWLTYDKSVKTDLDTNGNIISINVIEVYTYSDYTITVTTKKDVDGNIIDKIVNNSSITTEEKTEEGYSLTLKPTFALDENITPDELTKDITTYDSQYLKDGTILFFVVESEDPTKFYVDFVAKDTIDEGTLKSLIEKIAEDNFTNIVEWR